MPLASLANLGPKSAAFLAAAGIHSVEELASLGSVAAFAKVKRVEPKASLNLLWALEGHDGQPAGPDFFMRLERKQQRDAPMPANTGVS